MPTAPYCICCLEILFLKSMLYAQDLDRLQIKWIIISKEILLTIKRINTVHRPSCQPTRIIFLPYSHQPL